MSKNELILRIVVPCMLFYQSLSFLYLDSDSRQRFEQTSFVVFNYLDHLINSHFDNRNFRFISRFVRLLIFKEQQDAGGVRLDCVLSNFHVIV